MKRTSLVAMLAATFACDDARRPPSSPPGVTPAEITVTSPALSSDAAIAIESTCDGKDISPKLVLSAPPEGTASIVITLEDLDLSTTSWMAFDLPPTLATVPEAVDIEKRLGGKLATNDAGSARYVGPCPPRGEIHTYAFHVFALSAKIGLAEGARRTDVEARMNGRVLGEGKLLGRFSR